MTFLAIMKNSIFVKTAEDTFGAAFGKLGQLFIPTSGNTGNGQ